MDTARISKLVTALVKDLQATIKADAAEAAKIKEAWEDAKRHERTGMSLTEWREEYLTQVAVAWVLTLIFVRYLEDQGLIEPQLVSQVAQERQRAYFQEEAHKVDSDTDYLLYVIQGLCSPEAGELFRPERNPLYKLRISADAATKLLKALRESDPVTGDPLLDLRQVQDTRFLGDLYQSMSEDIRKKYALLQTPDFVERFILELTLERAIETFGLDEVRFIDPTCGSGHFLLGGFKRLYEHKRIAHPTKNTITLVRESLAATHGVDINPFAVAIAKFRLIVEAFKLCGITQWHAQISLPLRVAVGDSLILGKHFPRFQTSATEFQTQLELDRHRWDGAYSTEDNDLIFGDATTPGILTQQYHAVVGNPPYITVKDSGLRDVYKKHYASCFRKYSLVSPFFERFFELAIGHGLDEENSQMTIGGSARKEVEAGYAGLIVANSFMKRSYGQKLIKDIIPNIDLTHVIDTSGAYIPGHGTPTVILVGRNQMPDADVVRAVLGIRGEPSTPDPPESGKVWSSIVQNVAEAGFENDFISVDDSSRELFESHPWSLQGGGALDAKAMIEKQPTRLAKHVDSVGFGVITGADEAFTDVKSSLIRRGFQSDELLGLGEGNEIRDWSVKTGLHIFFPYNQTKLLDWNDLKTTSNVFWPFRTLLGSRTTFGGKTYFTEGRQWWSFHQFPIERFQLPLSITFAFVSTHNHFVLDRGGKVFKQSAPVIKLPADATIDDHLELLGVLNSSVACFFMKQTFFNKGDSTDSKGARTTGNPEFDTYEHDCTKMQLVPIPTKRPLELARQLDELAQQAAGLEPSALAGVGAPTPAALDAARAEQAAVYGKMAAFQEELDWRCDELYGLLAEGDAPLVDQAQWDELPEVALGERAFEIVMARKVAAGDLETTWFERHGSTPITEVPAHWPQWYQDIVTARIDTIEAVRFVRLIEQPVYKRRWNQDAWEDREREALKLWLLDRLESPAYIPQADREDDYARDSARLMRVRELADVAALDEDFMQVAARYTGDRDVDAQELVRALVLGESVPFLPSQRYKASGLERRKEWERVWALQRKEDAIDARAALPEDDPEHLSAQEAEAKKLAEVGEIGAPPNYTGADFISNAVYSLRGKLDVPKERFILYEGCELDDGSPVVAWAGLDHKQQAMALAAFYNEAKLQEGWEAPRLKLLLAGLLDLLPWVKQWHNELDPFTRTRLGDFLESFVLDQSRELALGLEAIEAARIGE